MKEADPADEGPFNRHHLKVEGTLIHVISNFFFIRIAQVQATLPRFPQDSCPPFGEFPNRWRGSPRFTGNSHNDTGEDRLLMLMRTLPNFPTTGRVRSRSEHEHLDVLWC
jgi:hypothetical protein